MDRAERGGLMQAIAELDDDSRSLLLERFFERTPLEDLARREGVTAVAIWKRIDRAKERLRVTLSGAGFAGGLGQALESITPSAAPSMLVTESILESAALAAGGAVVGTKAGISGSLIVAAVLITGAAGSGGYWVGVRRAPVSTEKHSDQRSASKESPTPPSPPTAVPSAKAIPVPAKSEMGEIKRQALELLREMDGSWLRGAAVAHHLLKLDPDVVLEALAETWSTLAVKDRLLILRGFEEQGHERIIDLIDLAFHDPDKNVQAAALNMLRSYGYSDFMADGTYDAWRKSIAGKPVDDVRRESARQLVRKLEEMTPQEALSAGRNLSRYCRLPQSRDALLQAGLMPVLERWLENYPSEGAYDILSIMSGFNLDEATLRRVVVPWMDRETPDGNARATAFHLLGKPGNSWAIDLILPYVLKKDPGGRAWTAANALAEIGDNRVIPVMIEAIARDNTYETVYGIGYYGLRKLTGVEYDKSHDGPWWTAWWEKNRGRFQPQK